MSKYPLLDEYIKKTREQGFLDDDIKKKLLETGYAQSDIDEVFASVNNPINKPQDISPEIEVHTPVSVIENNSNVSSSVLKPQIQLRSKKQPETEIKIKVNTPQKIESKPAMVVNSISQNKAEETTVMNQPQVSTNPVSDDSSVKITEDAPVVSSDFVMPMSNPAQLKSTQFVNVPKTADVQSKKPYALLMSLLIFVLLIAGGVYAYVNDINPFTKNQYTEENFLMGVFSKLSTIDTADYVFYTNAYMQEREADRTAFPGLDELVSKELKFKRDIYRASVLNNLSSLNRYTNNNLFPDTLEFEGVTKFKEDYHIEDVVFEELKKTYKQLNSGNGYEIEIRFETEEAVQELQRRINFELETTKNMFERYGEDAPTTSLRITFNNTQVVISNPEGEYQYYNVGYSLPKTFTQELVSMISTLSPEFKSEIEIDLKTESTQSGLDVALGLDLTGDMGDLIYRFSADVIKKQKDIFVRLNNFPSILATFVSIPKDQWIMASTDESVQFLSSNALDEDMGVALDFQKNTKEILMESLKIASDQKIIKFAQKPTREKIDNSSVYKYSLRIDETKIIPYLTSVIELIKNKESLKLDADEKKELDDLLVKIKEPQFTKEIQTLIKESMYFVWIDSDGYPIKFESKFVIVPDQKNESLRSKQFVIDTGFAMKNINLPVQIIAPDSYMKFEEIMENIFAPMMQVETGFE